MARKKTHQLTGRISISRVTGGDESYISIAIDDDKSLFPILRIKLDLETFADMITSNKDCLMKYEAFDFADKIGKVKEHKKFTFQMPNHADRDEARILALKLTPKGWTPYLYFEAQDSFYRESGKTYARTTIYRYVEEKCEKENMTG